jgi:hypothetical protein
MFGMDLKGKGVVVVVVFFGEALKYIIDLLLCNCANPKGSFSRTHFARVSLNLQRFVDVWSVGTSSFGVRTQSSLRWR